jgi:hypothetical protein
MDPNPKTPANVAASNRLARRREERLRKEAEVAANHAARLARNQAVREYRKAKADGTLPPVTPPSDIPDVGGYDNNGNLL